MDSQPAQLDSHPTQLDSQPDPSDSRALEPDDLSDDDTCMYTRILDPVDLCLPSLLAYNSLVLPVTPMPSVKVIPNDPATKPMSIPAPRNRKEALVSPWWPGYYQAELLEMKSLLANNTWQLCPRSDVPAGVNVLRDRWAYSDKLSPGGTSIEKFKARLTVMGCFQQAGVDYTDTYASVMSTRTFRMLLQLYNSDKEHTMLHWDVSTAFIHAPLKEKVYMKQATGHEVTGKESWVYLLVRALYGTKQAAHAWQQHLKGLLATVQFLPLAVDPATYLRRQGNAFAVVGTHVDDLFVVFNPAGAKLKDELWAHLNRKLTIKDLGVAEWTLQMLIQRDAKAGKLKISQESFIVEVLRRFNMSNCSAAPTPAIDTGAEATMSESDCPVTTGQSEEIADLPFLKLIGCLWWLAQMSRLDHRSVSVAIRRFPLSPGTHGAPTYSLYQ